MKYGVSLNGRLAEVVEVESPLPSWAADEAAWLEKIFPSLNGWIKVPDDAVNGTIVNEDGTYTTPKPSPVSGGRALRMDEFLKIGYGLGIAGQIDDALTAMPSLGLLLSRHSEKPGIEYADAVSQDSSTIKTAFRRMKDAGFVTDEQIGAFIAAWAVTYPAT